MKTILKEYNEVKKEFYSLYHEVRTDKFGNELDVYRVNFTNSCGNSDYVVFSSQSSAIDFILSNL